MNKSIVWTVLRVIITWIWRLALTAAVLVALCGVGLAMILNMVFNGPSEAARDTLALTLLESEYTRKIPGLFLDDGRLDVICSHVNTSIGTSDPNLVVPGSFTESDWPELTYPDGVRSETKQSDRYTAQILLIRGDSPVQFFQDRNSFVSGDHIIYSSNVLSGGCYAGFLDNGVLMLSDDPYQLLGGDGSAIVSCGPALILDGKINEVLLSGASSIAPRAAIGQRADGTVIFVTADGWTKEHPGAEYRDLINIMSEYGAVNACILHYDASYSCWMMNAVSAAANEE